MIREFHDINLRDRNSFRVAQRAARLVEFDTADDLRQLFAAGVPARWTVLAGGNNILFTEDYDGLLLTPAARGIERSPSATARCSCASTAGVRVDGTIWSHGPVDRDVGPREASRLIPGKAGAAAGAEQSALRLRRREGRRS